MPAMIDDMLKMRGWKWVFETIF